MPTQAERIRRVTAAQKRLAKAQADKNTLAAKIEALNQQIDDEQKAIEWLQAMPVTDPPTTTQTPTPLTGD